MPQLSQSIQRLKASATVAFNTKAKELARSGVDVIAMTAGEPDFQPPQHVFDAIREGLELGLTKYTASEGTLDLRQAVCNKFERENGLNYSPGQVIVSTGGKQVLYNAFMAVLNPGDEVIVPSPYWVSYPAQIELAGGVIVAVPTTAAEGFVPNPQAILDALTERTRVILINSPSNPTGAVYPSEVIREIVEIAAERDIWVFSDDIYEHLVYEGEFTSAAKFAPDKTLIIHGASKAYALTGWRIGYGVGPAPLIAAMNRLQGQSTSGTNSLAQHAVTVALNEVEKTAAFIEMTRLAYKERRDVLVEGLNRLGLATPNPQGAFYVMTDLTPIHADETVAATRLLEEARVGVVPGTDFLAPGQARLSYATSLDNVREALVRIERLLGQ
ncbi:MAG: pyridoxal phosphate-dependent aminotransferase [Trueperaceae bacterium]